MDIKFYEENSLWKFTDVYGVSQGLPLGSSKWSVNANRISLRMLDEPEWLFYGVKVTTILKSNTPNDYYTDLAEFFTLNETFFRNSVSLSNSEGVQIGIQNPLPTDGDSIYLKDIDWDNSDFTDWAGDKELLFKSPFSASVVNNTSNNPKRIVLSFNRTVNAMQLGLGENNGGAFSNLKISALGSGGFVRGIYDNSSNNTKIYSFNVKAPQELFNSFLIEFYTSDPISLSNITIHKVRLTVAQLEAYNPDTTLLERITATNGFLNVLTRGKEYDSVVNKWGQNDEIDTGTIPESIWDGSNLYTYTDVANPVTYAASSSNILDTSMINAELITKDPISGDFVAENTPLTLNGQNKVLFAPASGNLVLGCNRAYNANGTVFVGTIYIYESSAILSGGIPTVQTLIRSIIIPSAQQTRQAVYILPDIDTNEMRIQGGHVHKWFAGISKSKSITAEVYFMVQEPEGVFRVRDLGLISENKDAGYIYGEASPLKIPTKSKVELRVTNISANDGAVVGKFQIQKVTENEQF